MEKICESFQYKNLIDAIKMKTRNHLENFPKTIKLYIDESKMKELIDKNAEKGTLIR